jgi:hypothetical protein
VSKTGQGASASGRALNPAATLATIVATLLASAGLTATLPATAAADATLEGPPLFSSAPGLPDNRVYEQTSPTDKNGNQAGAGTSNQGEVVTAVNHYALAAPDGDSILFEATGPMGETAAAYNLFFVAQRSSGGWKTRSVMPSAQQSPAELGGTVGLSPRYLDPSSDLSHVMFKALHGTFAAGMPNLCEIEGVENHDKFQMYLSGPDPFVAATWLESPEIPNPIENCGEGSAGAPVGGTPDFSTVYFAYPGTLLPEDAKRAPHAHPGGGGNPNEPVEAWGFYENREGALHEAGVLPDGKLDEFGAVPAASGQGRNPSGNQVADEGGRAFFVSPDPASCEQNAIRPGHNDCAADPPELYVRENGSRTVLVSQDALLPEAGGLFAPAPNGVLQMPNPTPNLYPAVSGSYVFASPDGSQAFFQSEDALTKPAEEVSPGTEPKMYDFDVDTGTLTYLPGVAGQIVATDTDGSSFAFVKPASGGAPAEVDLWSAGPNGGSVTPITQLGGVYEARMSTDGSVLVFMTGSELSGAFNSGGFEQIFRYDVPANTLACVSCPPPGVTPTGNAVMSQLFSHYRTAGGPLPSGMVENRGISANGDRVFFDTPDPLVPQDTNTGSAAGQAGNIEPTGDDVYEWENGVVYLISSGKSSRNSYFLDNSSSGDDVFFATTEGLVPGDTDGAYDVYDARVPQPGDNPLPAAVPCEGAVCQGPPSVPSPLTPPASATFSGLGNPSPEVTPPPAKKVTTKTVKCKRGYVKKNKKCVKKSKSKKAKKASNEGRA